MSDYDAAEKYDRFEASLEILSGLENECNLKKSAVLDNSTNKGLASNELRFHYPLPSLENLFQELAPIPAYTVMIGACDDGSPILLDLTNPASGSLLLTGEASCGKTRLLTSMVQSACMVTSPRYLRTVGITSSLLEWHPIANNPHSYKWASTHSLEAAAIIRELARISEQRRIGRDNGKILILVIDELAELIETLDAESMDRLVWLITNGPACGTWTLASVETRQAPENSQVIRAFGTRLYGYSSSVQMGEDHTGNPKEFVSGLIAGAQFCVKVEDNWLRFWIPTTG
jgi:hypothetical protein